MRLLAKGPFKKLRNSGGLARALPKIVISPSLLAILFFVYGFILWTGAISFTDSTLTPHYHWVGLEQYAKLWNNLRWKTAIENLFLFAGLFVALCLFFGLCLAILLDQRIRAEGFIRTIYLYPMALSFIVTGTVWKWLLNPGIGLERFVQGLGWTSFNFDWIVDTKMSIYAIVIAAIWQTSGFIMALFLAGLRGVDDDLLKAAHLDGANSVTIYRRIILPSLRPVFLSSLVVLAHTAIKTFDLVIAMTGGGPGFSSDMPATFMYAHAFQRSQLALGSASAMVMLATIVAIMVPYLYSEVRGGTVS
jgi:glucose/mannose transport system permease protein